MLPPVNYVIESVDGSATIRVHFNRLKKNSGRIEEKSTAEDDKLEESFRKDWPATRDFDNVSPKINHTCH